MFPCKVCVCDKQNSLLKVFNADKVILYKYFPILSTCTVVFLNNYYTL